MRRARFISILVGALVCTALITAGAAAKGPGGGGGGGHEPGATNNLSVPTIMLGGTFTGVTCPGSLVYPSGTPLAGYELDPAAYYYVQGVHTWQAQCVTALSATARAEWGDNLAGDAKLKVGQPIRVELGLMAVVPDETLGWVDDTAMQGFNVVKLQPSELDRLSAYGTLATAVYDELGSQTGWEATAENLPARVFDPSVTFSVKNVATGEYAVPPGSDPTAEINATGKVVYGYNLRVTAAGQYEITFVMPKVEITGVDVGTYTTAVDADDTVTLVITVTGGGGGGGGGHS